MILIDNVEVKFGSFPNKESHLNFNNLKFGKMSVVTFKYESDQDLFNLYILKRYMDYAIGNNSYLLDILYMPYSRMDRANDVYTFNLKYVCDFINSLNFYEVRVLEPHSDVTPALLNNCAAYRVVDELFKRLLAVLPTTADLVVMYPDAGAEKRNAGTFCYPTVIGSKERDFATGNILKFGFTGADVKGKTVVIVDDLCSKGGTFVGAATALRNAGARKVYLIVTHCEDTITTGAVRCDIDKVFTTNSLLNNLPDNHASYIDVMDIINKKGDRY